MILSVWDKKERTMRKRILAPSILSADFKHLGKDIETAVEAGAEYLHIDVMDGQFVPTISFGMPVIKCIREVTDIVFDVHLMITNPERYLKTFKDLGADSISVHIETLEEPEKVLEEIRSLGIKAGLALNPETPIENVFPYLDLADMVMVMTVEPGIGGQKYINKCTPKIKALADEIARRGLDVDIEVDGGINPDTIDEALNAGANIIVAGTSIFGGDIKANAEELMKHF